MTWRIFWSRQRALFAMALIRVGRNILARELASFESRCGSEARDARSEI